MLENAFLKEIIQPRENNKGTKIVYVIVYTYTYINKKNCCFS